MIEKKNTAHALLFGKTPKRAFTFFSSANFQKGKEAFYS